MAGKGKTPAAAVESHSAASSTKFPSSLEKMISHQRKGPVPSDGGEMAGKNVTFKTTNEIKLINKY
jgi:hypothetical protein